MEEVYKQNLEKTLKSYSFSQIPYKQQKFHIFNKSVQKFVHVRIFI